MQFTKRCFKVSSQSSIAIIIPFDLVSYYDIKEHDFITLEIVKIKKGEHGKSDLFR